MTTATKRLFASLAVLALIATACGGGDDGNDGEDSTNAGAEEPFEDSSQGVYADRVDFGLIYDQTGPGAGTQVPYGHGMIAYFERVNNEGGVHGREINVLEEDEKYEVSVGVAAYNKLVEQTPVVGMSALSNSSFQGAVADQIDETGVPIVSQTTTKVAVNPFREYFFATNCSYADQADVAVAHTFSQSDADTPRVLTFVGNVASGHEWTELIQERVEQLGGEFLEEVSIEFGATEADAQAQRVESLDPDIIYMHGGTSIGVPVLTSLSKFGITDTPISGIWGLQSPVVPEAAPDVGDNFWTNHCYSAGQNDVEVAEQLIEDAQAAGYPEDEYVTTDFAHGYAVGMLVVEAMRQAGNELDRESLKAGFESIKDFDTGGLSPTMTLGPDDHLAVEAVRPYAYDFDRETFVPAGPFEQFTDCVQNEYVTESIEDLTVECSAP